MLVADTSVWIEFLNAGDSPHKRRMRQALADREVIVVEPVLLEVMAGVRRKSVIPTQRLLDAQRYEPLFPRRDWLEAARIFRELRWRGVTLGSQLDALIAATAIRLDVPVLHRDRDYDRIAQHTALGCVEV